MTRTRLLTAAAALTVLMVGTTQQTMAQQARVSVQVVVAPISRIAFTGVPGEGRSDPARAGFDADALASTGVANGRGPMAPSFTDSELRTSSSQSLELSAADAVRGGAALCATATDRRSARSTGPMPRLSMSYDADADADEPTVTCTLIAP